MSDAESAALTRLWFRCDEVMSLAEHAMACRPHLTGAQVLAGQGLTPGLRVHHAAGTAVLSSNGTPTWHDAMGAVRRATALTWQRTGQRNRPAHARDAFLPLHPAPAGGPPMIDLMRAARHRRQHWMAITVNRVRGHLIGPDAVTFTDHRDQPPPADAIWAPATVTSPYLADHTYPALIARDYHIAATPPARFDHGTVEQMVADLQTVWACPDRNRDPMPGEYPVLHFDGDVLIAYDTYDDVDEIDDTYAFDAPGALAGAGLAETDRYRPDRDGFYAVGAFLWSWHRTDARMPLAARLRLTSTALTLRLRARSRRGR